MEYSNTEFEPNLNADIYRNMTAADSPPFPDKHLQFVLIANDGSAVLGASNMTDRYWSGTVWFYADHSDFNRDKATAAMKTKSGVCDVSYLGSSDKFVIGEDNGAIRILGLKEQPDLKTRTIECLQYSFHHEDGITSISTFHDQKQFIAASMDNCIKVWDTQPLYASKSFHPAHSDIVTCVQVQPNSDSIFASTSLDHEALIWDIRQEKPATGITKNSDCGLTTLAWNPSTDHQIMIGDACGSITIHDVRQAETTPLHRIQKAFPRGVHKLVFNPDKSDQVAGCCDGKEVRVFSSNENMNVIYENKDHGDFVRGLAWHKNCLTTASWDNSVKKHVIP